MNWLHQNISQCSCTFLIVYRGSQRGTVLETLWKIIIIWLFIIWYQHVKHVSNEAFSSEKKLFHVAFDCGGLNERQLCLSSEYLSSVARKKIIGGPAIKLPLLKQFGERQISNHTSSVEGCFDLRQDNKFCPVMGTQL